MRSAKRKRENARDRNMSLVRKAKKYKEGLPRIWASWVRSWRGPGMRWEQKGTTSRLPRTSNTESPPILTG